MNNHTNIEVVKNDKENTTNLIRRFTRKMQSSGIIPKVKSMRYRKRDLSDNVRREKRLKALEKKERYEELVKLGKIVERKGRGGRRR